MLHDRLPTTGPWPPLFAVMGAHGGAGASALAAMWAPSADTERRWPAHPDTTQRVFVVAREHMSGIAAAAEVLRSAQAPHLIPEGVQVCGLITVAARPGKPHKDVQRYLGTVSELVSHTYRVPWLPILIPLLHRQLPSWQPSDGVGLTKTTEKGELGTVPSSIASIGNQICNDLAAARTNEAHLALAQK